MAAHKVGKFLAESGKLKTLSRAARRVAELEQLLSETTPRAFSGAIRIKGIRAGTLVVAADNSAVAAKLRQLAPRLLTYIRERDSEVTGIRFEVQPVHGAGACPAASRKQPIGATALAGLQALGAGLADSPLKQAVERLVHRHKDQVKKEK